jgi:small subunit ribosomal protein S21|tara:strand:+ start:1159 stop:1431 length:273 start_codon:yes stop_codon:yes gene_type:complete
MRPQQQKPYQQRKHFNKKFDKNKPRPLSFDQMLRKFKKKVERAGTVQELRKREYYEKPAQKRQRKKKEAIRREEIRWEGDQLSTRRTRFY